MSLPEATRQQVRERAWFACEYCSVSETDTAGKLTVDHFRPTITGGTESLDNLLYCCWSCNQYKADYWPKNPGEMPLWNPRKEIGSVHFIEMEGGSLHALTPVGAFTLRRLRLNRGPLVAYRLRKRLQAEQLRLLTHYRRLVQALEQLQSQNDVLLEEQKHLLLAQRALLERMLKEEP
jgi:hypothetical protein